MKIPGRLLLGAAVMLGVAAVTAQPEFILPALLLAGGSALTQRNANRKALKKSLAEMEQRLSLTEGVLEGANTELDQLRAEREFDRQLLNAPRSDVQRQLEADGVQLLTEADKSTSGPGSFMTVDPDGNQILIDQHV